MLIRVRLERVKPRYDVPMAGSSAHGRSYTLCKQAHVQNNACTSLWHARSIDLPMILIPDKIRCTSASRTDPCTWDPRSRVPQLRTWLAASSLLHRYLPPPAWSPFSPCATIPLNYTEDSCQLPLYNSSGYSLLRRGPGRRPLHRRTSSRSSTHSVVATVSASWAAPPTGLSFLGHRLIWRLGVQACMPPPPPPVGPASWSCADWPAITVPTHEKRIFF